MLVLSRRKDEEIVFPDMDISVQVLEVKGSLVRLGIRAPRSIRILRGELQPSDQWDQYEVEVPLDQMATELIQSN